MIPVYGECLSAGAIARVCIATLDASACEISAPDSDPVAPGEVEVWIGAMGPFAASGEWVGSQIARLRFHEALDERIIAHFNA